MKNKKALAKISISLFVVVSMFLSLISIVAGVDSNHYQISTGGNSNVDAAIDSAGNTHAVYERDGNIYYTYSYGDSKQAEELVGAGSSSSIAVDSNNVPHLVYLSGGSVMYVNRTGGSWNTPVSIAAANWANLDVDSQRNAHIVYDDGGTGGRGHVVYRKMYVNGTLSDPILEYTGWYDSGSGSYYHNPVIKIDSLDYYHVAFEQDSWGGRASWSSKAVVIVSDKSGGSSSRGGFDWNGGVSYGKNSLAIDGANNAHFIYTSGTTYQGVISSGNWLETSLGSLSSPAIASKGSTIGIAYVSGGDSLINYTKDTGAGFGAPYQPGYSGSNPSLAMGSAYIFYDWNGDILMDYKYETLPACGDGNVDPADECDDSNTDDGDGCSSVCDIESGWGCEGNPSICTSLCGNGNIDEGEACEIGDSQSCAVDGYTGTQSCESDCTAYETCTSAEYCGDGIINGDENCDDDNSANDDGCSSVCAVESGYTCVGVPSTCNLNARYVATTGTDSGDCKNPASPCLTITYAIGQADESDAIIVSAGTYNEQVTVNKNNLLIKSVDGAVNTIIVPTDTTNGGIVLSANGVTIDGFTVRDFTDSSNENKIIRINSNNNIIQNNVIQGNLNQAPSDQTEYGILFQSTASGNLVDSNEIYDMGYMGVNIAPDLGTNDNTISNNNIHDIGIYAIGIDRSPDNTITGNTISDIVGGTLWGDYYDPATWSWGIIVWGADSTGTVIDNNLTGLPNGIVLSAAQGVTVQNSEISNMNYIGIKLADSSWIPNSADNNVIQYNKIHNNQHGIVVKSGGLGGIGSGNQIKFNQIYDNEVVDTGLHNYATPEIDATNNWWGSVTGPTVSENIGGTGDSVEGNVDYNPWCINEMCTAFDGEEDDLSGLSKIVKLVWGLIMGSNADSDDDDMNDLNEIIAGTDPTNPDTDGDGLLDGDDPSPTNPDANNNGIPDGIYPDYNGGG